MMRTRLGLALATTFLLFSKSSSPPFPPGMLTDDFGIITQLDVEKEAAIIRLPSSLKVPTVFPYWRCLQPQQIEMYCENVDAEEPPGSPIFAPHLSLSEGEEKYEYYTRRPWSLDICEETLSEWRGVIDAETVVCISATIDAIDESLAAAPWRQVTYGEINRMKSHAGKWSYFIDDDTNPASPNFH